MLIEAPTMPVRLLPMEEPPKEVTDADVYERAAELIDERGWTRGAWEHSDGRVCLLGAIGVAVIELDHPISESLYFAQRDRNAQVMAASEMMVGSRNVTPLWVWNDTRYDQREGFLHRRKTLAVDQVKIKLRQMANEARKENT